MTKNEKNRKKEEEKMPGSRFTLTPEIKREIVKLVDERISEAYITKEDFTELKSIMSELAIALKELAQAQKRTEERVEELAQAQKRTEERVEELAQAQKRTEERVDSLAQKVEELVEAQKRTELEVQKLAIGLHETRVELGGLSRSFSYAFENEAYRNLPGILKEKYGYEMTERLLRTEISGKEINLFGKAIKDGREFFIVGESKVRLDSEWRLDVFEELDRKIEAVKSHYGDVPIVPLLVTHFAKNVILSEAQKRGIIVVQSFEW